MTVEEHWRNRKMPIYQNTYSAKRKIWLEMIVAPVVLRSSFSFPAEDDASKFAKKDEESEKKKKKHQCRLRPSGVMFCNAARSSWLRHLSFQLYSYDDGKLGSRMLQLHRSREEMTKLSGFASPCPAASASPLSSPGHLHANLMSMMPTTDHTRKYIPGYV